MQTSNFWSKFDIQSAGVTLKMSSRSPESNHFFLMSPHYGTRMDTFCPVQQNNWQINLLIMFIPLHFCPYETSLSDYFKVSPVSF